MNIFLPLANLSTMS